MTVSVLSKILIYSASQQPSGVALTVFSLLLGKMRHRDVSWLATRPRNESEAESEKKSCPPISSTSNHRIILITQ